MKYLFSISLFFCAVTGFSQPTIPPNQLRGLVGGGVKVLSTDNAGAVSWQTISVPVTANQIAYGTGVGITSSSNFNYSNNNLSVGGTTRASRANIFGGVHTDSLILNIFGGFSGFTHNGTTMNLKLKGQTRLDITDAGRFTNFGKLNNIFIGNAGREDVNAYYNIALGDGALISNTSSSSSIAIGADALRNSTSSNLAIGASALYSNTSAYRNVGVGASVLYYNKTGLQNTGLADGALYFLDGGHYNVGISTDAGSSNIVGNYNVSIGIQANGLQEAGDQFTITSFNTTTQRVTVSGINIPELIGKRIQFKTDANVSGWGYPYANYWIDFVVISSASNVTVLELKTYSFSGGTLTGNEKLYIRKGYNISNSLAIGSFAQNTKSNELVMGGSSITDVGFKSSTGGAVYNFKTPLSILTIGEHGKWWSFNSNTNSFEITNTLLAGNGTIGSPSISSKANTGHGFSFDATNIYTSVNGSNYLTINSSGLTTNAIKLTSGAALNKVLISDALGNGTWGNAPNSWLLTGNNNVSGTGAGAAIIAGGAGQHNTLIGQDAGKIYTTHTANINIGGLSGDGASSTGNVALGWATGRTSIGSYNFLGGYNAGYGLIGGSRNVIIQQNGAVSTTTGGNDNVHIGTDSGAGTGVNSNVTTVGARSTAAYAGSSAFGADAQANAANQLALGGVNVTNIKIPTGASITGLKTTNIYQLDEAVSKGYVADLLQPKSFSPTIPSTGSSYVQSLTENAIQTYFYDLSGRTTTFNFDAVGHINGNLYIFIFYNKATGYAVSGNIGTFYNYDGTNYGNLLNSSTVSGSLRFVSRAGKLYPF
jgi:hypothetical protein